MNEVPTPNPQTPQAEPAKPYKYRGAGTCGCHRCHLEGIGWPILIITVGGLFLTAQLLPGVGFRHLWPVILIVLGVLKLLEHTASTEGHRG
ncbi:MAG: hypothetical protein ACE5HB_00855 [Terriglobia bacterium]